MKKIVIVTNKLVYGGIETALLEFIGLLITKYDVTLVLKEPNGDLYDRIPKSVKVLNMNAPNSFISAISNSQNSLSKIQLIFNYMILKFSKSYGTQCEILCKLYPKIQEQYDLAIAYSTPVSLSNYYVINNISAKSKIMFIHNDVKEISISPLESKKLYFQFDKIFAVSKYAKNSFLSYFPELNNKTSVIYNPINKNDILTKSSEHLDLEDDADFSICTVGRLEYEKGQDIIPQVIHELNKDGIYVKWYLIGDGELKQSIKQNANVLKVENQLKFLGYQQNPYKFMKHCTIYAQTSRQEGFGVTIAEAKILKKPIVTTNFPCAYEQIENGINGLIVNFESKSIYYAIKELILNQELRNSIINNLNNFDYKNDISEIYNILNN